MAIVWACKYFRRYLLGCKFNIHADHGLLIWLFKLKEPNSKLSLWRLRLEEYNYKTVYKIVKLNSNADALSRIPLNIHETESTINNPGDISREIEKFLTVISHRTIFYELSVDDFFGERSETNSTMITQFNK